MNNPRARHNDVFSEALASETILYDKANHRAHSLNKTVVLVWQSADGQKSVDDIAEILHLELGIPIDRSVVLLALEELAAAGLLEEPLKTAPAAEPTRRQVARRLALAGVSAALIPAVASVIAPTPAMASSAPINKDKAGFDLGVVAVESEIKTGGNPSPTVVSDLNNAGLAYQQGNYSNEISDLDQVIKILGLPPLT